MVSDKQSSITVSHLAVLLSVLHADELENVLPKFIEARDGEKQDVNILEALIVQVQTENDRTVPENDKNYNPGTALHSSCE